MEKKYLNTQEACEFLGISKATLFRLKKEGRIPFIKLGNSLKFDKDDLIKFMNNLKEENK